MAENSTGKTSNSKNFSLKDAFWNRTDFKFNTSIILRSLSTGGMWVFPAFVTDFNDSYKSSWKTTEVYGRIDPIYTFQSTTRTISLGFVIVAFDLKQAFENWVNVNEMTQSLYANYKTVDGEKIISSPPIFGLKFQNLLREVATGDVLQDFVYGVLTSGIAISPDVKNGFLFDQNMVREYWDDAERAHQYRKLKENYGFGDTEPESGLLILPKFYSVKLDFAVLHTVFRGNERGVGMSLGGPMVSTTKEKAKEYTDHTRTQTDKEETEKRRTELSNEIKAKNESKVSGSKKSSLAVSADKKKQERVSTKKKEQQQEEEGPPLRIEYPF